MGALALEEPYPHPGLGTCNPLHGLRSRWRPDARVEQHRPAAMLRRIFPLAIFDQRQFGDLRDPSSRRFRLNLLA
jgi:hypothetical protein